MGTAKRYSAEVRERAVRMVFEHEGLHDDDLWYDAGLRGTMSREQFDVDHQEPYNEAAYDALYR